MELYTLTIIPLWCGFILDTITGDHEKLPHPVRLFGRIIEKGTTLLNKGNHRMIKGLMLTLSLLILTYCVFFIICSYLANHAPVAFIIFALIFVHYGLANKQLIKEGQQVLKKLNHEGLKQGRKQLSNIVGRNTDNLHENQVRAAVLETMAENLSDGVIAPLFFYAIGGIPAMMTYKMINTLDSMIGYKNEKFKEFGRIAARTDDIANYIPARITAVLMALLGLSRRGLVYIFKYGHKHSSPNAGYPEAALAGILNCRFGGTHYYHGKRIEKPYIGDTEKQLNNNDFYKAVKINYGVSTVFIIIISVITLLSY